MKISVIIPTLNEATRIRSCLFHLMEQAHPNMEIIIADGASTDEIGAIVAEFSGVTLLTTKVRCRGQQLQAGARLATGDVLLFLHADTQLPPNGLPLIAQKMQNTAYRAGCFALRFDDPHPLLRLLSWMSRWNNRWCTFGDQALFVDRQFYEQLGGFRPWPILEDFDLQCRLRQHSPFIKFPDPVQTSARRFLQNGILRQTLRNMLLVLAFSMGWSPHRLAKFYR